MQNEMTKYNSNHSNKIGNLVVMPEDALNELLETQKNILSSLTNSDNQNSFGDWLDEKSTQKVLGKKTTTLWSLRKKGLLTYTKIGNKIFYSKSDILKLLEANKQGGGYGRK